MFKSGSPNLNSCAGSSIGSTPNWEHKNYECEKPARMFISWSLKNPGRRFLTCYKAEGCKFFQWCDNDFTGRSRDVICHLNNSRIFLEEKMSLVEKKLATEVEKKLTVEDNNKKLGRVVKFFSYVIVVLIAVLIMKCSESSNNDRLYLNP